MPIVRSTRVGEEIKSCYEMVAEHAGVRLVTDCQSAIFHSNGAWGQSIIGGMGPDRIYVDSSPEEHIALWGMAGDDLTIKAARVAFHSQTLSIVI